MDWVILGLIGLYLGAKNPSVRWGFWAGAAFCAFQFMQSNTVQIQPRQPAQYQPLHYQIR